MSFLRPVKTKITDFLESIRSVESVYFLTDTDNDIEPDYRAIVVTLGDFRCSNEEKQITFELVIADKFPEGDVDAYLTSMEENFSIVEQLHDFMEVEMAEYDYSMGRATPIDRPQNADDQYPSMAVVGTSITVFAARKIGRTYDNA